MLIAGSVRRQADSVKDLDLVATSTAPAQLAAQLAALEQIESVSSAGQAGARGLTHSGIAVELRIAAPEQRGNLLQHLTGSGAHNAALREIAVRRGLHLSEYGVLDDAGGLDQDVRRASRRCTGWWACPTSSPSCARTAASCRPHATGRCRELIALGDIRGDLHSHTHASDGHNTIAEMGAAARERGYEYLAITDHSASHGFGNDVSPQQLERQIELVAEANERLEGIELLAGSEVNILPDGSLDYEDELLARLDWVVASVHTSFAIGEQAMTERMITAIEHPLVDVIAHPTGRLIERRAPYAVDLDAVFEAAARTGTMLEINGNPDRRDLSDVGGPRRRGRRGDDRDRLRRPPHAHAREHALGRGHRRRAWLTAAQVANTRSLAQLRRLRKQARR